MTLLSRFKSLPTAPIRKYSLHWLQGIPTQWRAYVLPREEGTYRYEASVRCGSDVAVRLGEEAGRLCASE